jgi:hypothetical protein
MTTEARDGPASIGHIVDLLLDGSDDRAVAIGPMVQQPQGGPPWYFMTAVNKGGRFFVVSVNDDDYEPPCQVDDVWAAVADVLIEIRPVDARSRLITALKAKEPGVTIHQFDDELAMLRRCEKLWPSERVTRIRRGLEQERARAGAAT